MDLKNARKSTTQVNVTITNDLGSNNRTMTQVNINVNIKTKKYTFKYTIDQLLEVRRGVNNDVHLRRLNPDTCKVLRNLRLKRQGKRGGVKNHTRPSGCN